MSYTVTPTVSITSPNVISTTGSFTLNSPVWNTISDNYTISAANGTGLYTNTSGQLSLNGKDADIVINGESLVAMLKRIEERINLLTVNHELESEWEELRELGNQYRELEQRIKDKLETWNKLQAQDRDNR
jgi:hypothetical protein